MADGATGKCVKPTNTPFRLWTTAHKREIVMAPTEDGIIGVMTARAGDRWGVYLAQAGDGTLFERQRVIGEGTVDRGRIELGALVSDDGGTSWNPP